MQQTGWYGAELTGTSWRAQIVSLDYRCPECGKAYRVRPNERGGCLVLRTPGKCCHNGEEEVTGE